MITFGGRPLNTYRGSNRSKVVDVQPESMIIKSPDTPTVVDVQLESMKIKSPDTPIVVDVQPKSMIIRSPMHSSEITNATNISEYKIQQKQLLELGKGIRDAENKNGFWTKIFGSEIVGFFTLSWKTLRLMFTLIIFFIIFSICYFLYEITQGILNASHQLLDGVSSALTKMNDAAIKFNIPGVFRFNQKLFGGAFTPWIRDVDRSNNKFPRQASELIIDVLTEMMKGIANSLPGIVQGMTDAAPKIFGLN